jgi:hypothetical protein
MGFDGLADIVLTRMRVWGRKWLDEEWLKDYVVTSIGRGLINWHPCTIVQISWPKPPTSPMGRLEIWIDDQLRVARRIRCEGTYEVTYKTIRLNQPFPADVFDIPAGAVIQSQPATRYSESGPYRLE